MEVLDKINSRIAELSTEAEELVAERESISDRIHDINVRIAHIVGAIRELDALIRTEENNDV